MTKTPLNPPQNPDRALAKARALPAGVLAKKVCELKSGDQFSLTSRKNAKLFNIGWPASGYPAVSQLKNHPDEGKWLVICSDCRQLILEGDQIVFIHCDPTLIDVPEPDFFDLL